MPQRGASRATLFCSLEHKHSASLTARAVVVHANVDLVHGVLPAQNLGGGSSKHVVVEDGGRVEVPALRHPVFPFEGEG